MRAMRWTATLGDINRGETITMAHIVRIFEFQSLNVWWDDNAYGSIVWVLLGFHTAHILTDFVDVSENAMYWYFIVLSWIPIYVVIYIAPRVW